MAVKIFCKSCQKFIKDARHDEIPQLRGTEICVDCEAKYRTAMDDVIKISKRGIVRIETARDKCKADLEEAMRNIISREGEDGEDM